MGRPKKDAPLQEKMQKYLETYGLDDLNQANDEASLVQMCRLEVNIEKLQKAIDSIDDPAEDPRKIKDLNTALKDAINSWTNLQTELGINRKKRQSETDESPLAYIDRLQTQAKTFLASRLKELKCKNCGQVLGKYFIYVPEKGERGSIESETKPVEFYPYSIKMTCWKCDKLAEDSNENA